MADSSHINQNILTIMNKDFSIYNYFPKKEYLNILKEFFIILCRKKSGKTYKLKWLF